MLADMQLRALKPAKKIYKVADRRGLYAAVTPSGADITGTTFNRAFTFDSLRAPVKRGALWLAVFLVMAVICLPGLWVMLNAFRSNVAILSNQPLLDAGSYTLDNFRNVFGFGGMASLPIRHYFVNSVVISLASTIAAIVVGVAGGYAFARFEFRHKKLLFVVLMLTRAIPGIALSLPIFMLWAWTGLLDTHIGVLIVYLAMNVPFTVWLIDGFFREVPAELAEAAQIDGCSRWQAFWHIELPLARSGGAERLARRRGSQPIGLVRGFLPPACLSLQRPLTSRYSVNTLYTTTTK
jgi:multiple sugar transport system permease protein